MGQAAAGLGALSRQQRTEALKAMAAEGDASRLEAVVLSMPTADARAEALTLLQARGCQPLTSP